MDHFYNTRPPTLEESQLIVGTGEVMQVKCIGDLDVVLHCNEDVVVTLREVSFVPGLWYELTSFNTIQETEDIVLNKTGAHMLRGQVRFDQEKNGNYVQATRMARDSRGPPAMVAAVVRPGRQRRITSTICTTLLATRTTLLSTRQRNNSTSNSPVTGSTAVVAARRRRYAPPSPRPHRSGRRGRSNASSEISPGPFYRRLVVRGTACCWWTTIVTWGGCCF